MKIVKALLLAVVLLVGGCVALFAWLGVFDSVEVIEQEVGPIRFVVETLDSTDAKAFPKAVKALQAELEAAGCTELRFLQQHTDTGMRTGFAVTAPAELKLREGLALELFPAQPCDVVLIDKESDAAALVKIAKAELEFAQRASAGGGLRGPRFALDRGADWIFFQARTASPTPPSPNDPAAPTDDTPPAAPGAPAGDK